jgi:hypothetical protein
LVDVQSKIMSASVSLELSLGKEKKKINATFSSPQDKRGLRKDCMNSIQALTPLACQGKRYDLWARDFVEDG